MDHILSAFPTHGTKREFIHESKFYIELGWVFNDAEYEITEETDEIIFEDNKFKFPSNVTVSSLSGLYRIYIEDSLASKFEDFLKRMEEYFKNSSSDLYIRRAFKNKIFLRYTDNFIQKLKDKFNDNKLIKGDKVIIDSATYTHYSDGKIMHILLPEIYDKPIFSIGYQHVGETVVVELEDKEIKSEIYHTLLGIVADDEECLR